MFCHGKRFDKTLNSSVSSREKIGGNNDTSGPSYIIFILLYTGSENEIVIRKVIAFLKKA